MSEFKTKCPHCNSEFQVQEAWIGQQASCPSCGSNFTISRPASGNFPGVQYNQTGAAVPLPGAAVPGSVPGGQYNQTGTSAPLPGGIPGGQYNQAGAAPGGQYNQTGAASGGIPGGQFNPGGSVPGGQYYTQSQPSSSIWKLLNFNSPEYCKLDGRASRKEFWVAYLLICVLGSFALAIIGGVVGGIIGGIYAAVKYSTDACAAYGGLVGGICATVFCTIYLAYIIVPMVCLQIRRLHDSGIPGGFVFLWLPIWVLSACLTIPGQAIWLFLWPLSIFCAVTFLFLMLRSGTPGKNQYDEKQ